MSNARKSSLPAQRVVAPALSVNVDVDPLVEVVMRHVKLTPQVTRRIRGELVRLFERPVISGHSLNAMAPGSVRSTDPVLSTQEAADLLGVSRPYIVARIDAGDIPLHQQVGNQRRVRRSAVLAWQRREQTRRRKALGQLGADLESEIFTGSGAA